MKRRPETNEDWMRERFPDLDARRAADKAVDSLSEQCSMLMFIDVWIAAYEQAAGKKWRSP